MLGPLLRALQHTLRALMRLLRADASPEAPRSPPGAEAPGAALCDGDGWQLAYEDPLEFPSATLKSAESRHSLYLRFINCTPEAVRLVWIDYSGSPVRYKTIEPGRSHRQQSFLSHPWTAVPAAGAGMRFVLNGQPAIFPLADSEAPASVLAEVQAGAGPDAAAVLGDPAADAPREVMTVRIERPPPLAWSTGVHCRFPPCFQDAARCVLLIHARLAAEAADATSPGSPRAAEESRFTLGSLPVHLRDEILALAAPRLPHYLPVRLPRASTPEPE